MIELPEAAVLAGQFNSHLTGKAIARAVANQSPHKFAWYTGDPAHYNHLLAGKTIGHAGSFGNHVEVAVDEMLLVLSTNLRYHVAGEKPPARHQLLLEFSDGSALSATIQMWGGLFCFKQGEPGGMIDYQLGKERPSPLSADFDQAYFARLFNENTGKLSAKAFLATEQRIPGLGNGVLQDILWTAAIHPKRKMAELSQASVESLFKAVKSVLAEMAAKGGRDTEKDLFDRPGGYTTVLSRNTVGKPCPACGATIQKESYMGGAIYYCPGCQP
ncbi:MAG: DNA-formamidopyrimidine glycosylase family protein [Chloroflexota bacterium]